MSPIYFIWINGSESGWRGSDMKSSPKPKNL